MCIQFVACFSPSYWIGCIPCFFSRHQLGKGTRDLLLGVGGARRQSAGVSSHVDIDIFRRICVATLDHYSSDLHEEISALVWIVDALGPDVLVVPISGGSTMLVGAFCKNLDSGYRQNLIDYPSFDLRLFKRCLQRTAFSVFGSLDGLTMTELIVNRLKGAEIRDWMSSRLALRKAILRNDLGMPHLVDIVANIIGVWPLIVS